MIYAQADERRLAAVRIFVLLLWSWEVGRDPFPDLARFPREWFDPHGVLLLVPGGLLDVLWNRTALVSAKVVTLSCLVLALLGARGRRVWAAAAAVMLTVVTSFVRGFGHPDHADVQLLLVTYALIALPAWDIWTLSKRGGPPRSARAYRASFAALALVFSFPYYATGVYRLVREGAPLFFGQSILHFMARDTASLDHFDYTHGAWLVEHGEWLPAYNFAFFLVTLAELGAPWAPLGRRYCLIWLGVMLPFHLLSPALMHVFFGPNVALILVLYAWPLLWKGSRDANRASSHVISAC